jgi:PAS domain S-box-containing protein
MAMQQNNALSTNAIKWILLLSGLSMVLGCAVLYGWIWDIDALKSVLPGVRFTKVNSAISLELCGLILCLQSFQATSRAIPWFRRMCIALVLLIGLLTLSEYFFDWDAGIDQLLFRALARPIQTPFTERMSIMTAVCFVVLGGAFLLIELNRYRGVSQCLAIVPGVVAMLTFGGYLYGDAAFLNVGTFPPMAFFTAMGIMLLSASALILTSVAGFAVRLRNKLPLLGIGVALALMLLSGDAVFYNIKQIRISTRLVEHTYELRLHLESVVSNLHVYRTNMRSFLVGLDEYHRLKAEQARDRLLLEFNAVKGLPGQHKQLWFELNPVKPLAPHIQELNQRIIALQPLIDQHFAMINELPEIRRKQGINAAETSFTNDQADRIFQEIIRIIEEIKTSELSELQEQQQADATRTSISTIAINVSLVLSLILLFGIFLTLRREIAQSKQLERELKFAAQYTRSLIEVSLDPLVTISAHGKITDVNNATERVTGVNRDKLIGTDFADYFTDPGKAREGYQLVFFEGFVTDYPLAIRHLSGKVTDVLYNASVYRDRNGNILGVFAAARDITETKKIEKALRESETRLRSLFDTTAIGIVVIDEQGLIEEFNPASEIIFAYSKAEVIGQNVNLLMPEPYRSEHNAYLKNHLEDGPSKIIGKEREVTGMRKGNEIFPLQLFVGEAKLNNHSIFTGFIQDITKRKQIESESRHFEAIVQSSDDAIISKTLDGIITSWNPGTEALYGYTAEEMIGVSPLKMYPPDRVAEERYFLERIGQGERINHYETIRIRKDGTLIDVSMTLSPIFDEAGKVTGISGIARNITQSKQLERELQTAKELAETANRAKSVFLANMSHEIRTPMNALIGLTRLALETELAPQQQDYLHKIQTASQTLLQILNDILDLSKIESGRIDIEHIEFYPTEILQNVYDLLIPNAEEKGLKIFLNVAPEIPMLVLGDPLRTQQVLSNLLSNAIKFTQKGEIHIDMVSEEGGGDDLLLRLSVRDTGIGIDEATLKRLFKPFSQADASTTRKFGGTGLGLVICKHLVELMGGNIFVTSQPNQGSTFSFTVRCSKGAPYNWNLDSFNLKGTQVVIVDDQEDSSISLKHSLESWQFQVAIALSKKECFQLLDQAEQADKPVDFLLLNWPMKNMDGLNLARELIQAVVQGRLQHRPVIIMVTTYSKEQLLKESVDMSDFLDAILGKPSVPTSLLNIILRADQHLGKDYRLLKTPINPYEAARPLRNARILLVEDNRLNQQVIGEFLEKAGLSLSIANHGGEALQWVQKSHFDGVLMDLQMPEMDGYEATRRIRELPNCRELPIIAMSAAVIPLDNETILSIGMNDSVSKPIIPMELVNTLLRWIKPTADPLALSLPPSPASRELWSDLADKLPGFELRDIMTILNGDQAKLVRMLAAFQEQFVGEAPAIADKIKAGELALAEKLLHRLKGAAGNLGAQDLHQASAALNAQLVNGKYQAETLAHWVETFDKTMTTLADMLSQQSPITPTAASVHVPSGKSGTEGLPSAASADTLQQILAELDGLLAKDGFINDELLSRLKTSLPDNRQMDFAKLIQNIHDTDYPKARTVLNILRLPNGKS